MAESSPRKAGRKSAGDEFALGQAPGHLLRRAQQYAFDLYTAQVGTDGLTPRQFAVLLTVDQNEGLSQTDLVGLTGIDRSTLADMISRLLKRDLLARKRTEADQRANSVRITAAGRKALKSALPAVARAESALLEPLPAGRRTEFLKLLTVIAEAGAALAAQEPPAKPKGRKRVLRKGGRPARG